MNRITPELVVEALRSDIASGRVKPGAVLRQEELAARFGISRIPVREALRQLEAEGIVIVQANRGAFVRSFTVEELKEIYDLRILLETDLLKRSIDNMAEADIRLIEAEIEAGKGKVPASWMRLLDRRFHLALYQPARRPQQLEIVMKLRNSIEHYSPADDHMRQHKADWMNDHRKIVAACARKDADTAARILRNHLATAAKLTLRNAQADQQSSAGGAAYQL